jgi:hypothetical protein
MSRFRNGLARLCGLAVLMLLATGSARAGVISLWNGSGSNDSTSWAGLGSDGTSIASPFTATSTGGVAITGSFAGGTGLTSVSCPASPSCSWTGGFAAGDHLVWAFNNATGTGTGALTLSFGAAVLAGGLELQADAPGAFTAQVQAFDGGSLLGTESLTSDTAGDPIFIGALDTVAEITSLSFDLTSCAAGCDPHDFAVDTLLSENPSTTPPVPEPASVLLFGGALTALGLIRLGRPRFL